MTFGMYDVRCKRADGCRLSCFYQEFENWRINIINPLKLTIMGKYPGVKLKMEHGNAGEFGKYYTGSAKAKQNHRKAKMMAKRSH